MATENGGPTNPWLRFYGPNLGYINQCYEQYRKDPGAVDETLRDLFDRWGPPPVSTDSVVRPPAEASGFSGDKTAMQKAVAAEKLAENIRTYGHLVADIDPLRGRSDSDTRLIQPEAYDLTEEDLKRLPADIVWPEATGDLQTGWDVICRLKKIYTQSLAYEFSHVHDVEERNWLNRMVESDMIHRPLSKEKKVDLLKRLTEVETFEKFLHRTFVGQKRFSVEGLDVLVPLIDDIIYQSVHDGVRDVNIGMAHRGRLNVLAHILGKPYETIFSEFHHAPDKDLVPSEGSMGINYGWTGDVKYHLGADRSLDEGKAVQARIHLANNPSHLEFVNPVVEGSTRAAQENRDRPGFARQDVSRALAVLVHGDAAFPGEGIVAETLNFNRLNAYHTGGTIHIIANNLLGFTTESADARSTRYASDLAKGYEIPIVHVNADDPEACLAAVNLAYAYRSRFQKDFLIDLIGYRRFGHNEMDDPSATQPQLYARINKRPSARGLYAETLQREGAATSEEVEAMEKTVQQRLQQAYKKIKENGNEAEESVPPLEPAQELPQVDTGVSVETLHEINDDLLKWPENFTVYPKLERVLNRRADLLKKEGKVDWALAETLSFATILKDGTPIRMTGQDSERGTFAHRHLMLHDPETGTTHSPLHTLPQARASFSLHNSPLSEASVLGFEYGYDVFAPETLVIWEAQYGDFANAGQVIIDQFLAAGRAKWAQKSSLVLLLPHGYEGQGPEHSSARLERFLQSAAENNWTVANLTNAAQYFHILRRQAALGGKKESRPLIIMSPKSLIRNRRTLSPGSDFENGGFQTVLEQTGLGQTADRVTRLILCSGKVAIDLESELESASDSKRDRLHLLRVEQLYPFPEEEIRKMIRRYKNLKEIVWVQEEPQNMGAWTYMEPKIKALAPEGVAVDYIGRPERSSPAEGMPDVHNIEQKRILSDALGRP
ncbi:2-oxoglutarate dehydrogenase E1 component [Paludifilum halophilum]|uniref:2-oxoglutarate dehydrogenase E1 component n=1 Tax=Paludifilum halophilum TaxID=1642702 RepID=A0A235B861_9BACL|nr:2-oxoglutarate dehydrogenase E1 component [Paludifilum halophilum]OYD08484.1 2-oxoglutarate dehydrogenase E1 component [Paludifilum halophilum]